MNTFEHISLFALRVSLGWMFFYAGITKVLDPHWSAAGYLQGAKTFAGFYGWLSQPVLLPAVNFMNEWGLVMLGVALIFGLFVRLASFLGSVLMLLYYFPILAFPYVGHYFVIDEHIIFMVTLLYLGAVKAGRVYGLETWCSNLPLCKKYPVLRKWVG